MIDTLRINGDWPLRKSVGTGEWLKIGDGHGGHIRARASNDGHRLRSVECSLSILLFGHNGRPLRNQDEVEQAIACLRKILNDFAYAPGHEEWLVWRMDLAWNFLDPARPIILAHSGVRIPGIRNSPLVNVDGNVALWSGSRSRFCAKLYDQGRKAGHHESVLRAEITLCGEKLQKALAGQPWWKFDAQYAIFRRIWASVPPVINPVQTKTVQQAIGFEELEVQNRIFARVTEAVHSRTMRRWRAEAASVAATSTFSWAEMLPEGGPPPPVVVPPRRSAGLRRLSTQLDN